MKKKLLERIMEVIINSSPEFWDYKKKLKHYNDNYEHYKKCWESDAYDYDPDFKKQMYQNMTYYKTQLNMLLRELEKKRVTPQRIAIFRYLLSTDSHPTAQQIYSHVKEQFPTITLATVYKTLEMLEELGKAKELGFSGLSTRFEANMEPHINLICLKCGTIKDLNDKDSLEHLKSVVDNHTAFTIKDQRVEFYGYCAKCQNNS